MTDPSEYKGVWTLAETAGGRVARVGYELLARGRSLADKRSCELTALVMGNDLAADDLTELIERGADVVLRVEAPQLDPFLVEPHAACLAGLIERHKPEIVIAGATTTGRTLMPYVAIKVRAGLTADCTGLDIDAETGGSGAARPSGATSWRRSARRPPVRRWRRSGRARRARRSATPAVTAGSSARIRRPS